MAILVACETLLLVALTFLVVGLLRSHAEILRRIGPGPAGGSPARDEFAAESLIPPPERRADLRPGRDIAGLTPSRDALKVALDEGSPPTLLAFLSSGCGVCDRFWQDLASDSRLAELPREIRLVAVTKGLHEESPSRIRELAPETLQVVMSSEAWRDYRAPAAPYFVYLEHGQVRGEGSASSWMGIASLLRDAIDDLAYVNHGERRTAKIDQVLMASGIGPGHPSLYPNRSTISDRLEPDAGEEMR